ncbi:hypothetical protein ACXET9_03575 [Brachybacterium sp. DNPG3]
MPTTLHLVQRPASAAEDTARIAVRDVYDLDRLDLDAFTGIILARDVDQRFLARHRDRLSDWVRSGGRLLVSGHPQTVFVERLPLPRQMEFRTEEDLRLSALERHPIWEGADRSSTSCGCSYLADLPTDAQVITGIGLGRLPVDVSYPLGAGEVVVHGGGDLLDPAHPGRPAADLLAFAELAGDPTAAEEIAERILDHLELAPALQTVTP